MRRVIIIRKDLHLKPGKLAAMVGHCCEAYFTNLLKLFPCLDNEIGTQNNTVSVTVEIPKDIWNDYVNGIFTKTICEAKNLKYLNNRALPVIEELGLKEGTDWGYINDCCLTDLTPENEDGTTTIGMWFKPLKDEDAFKISKKFKLYRDD